ncbi:xyloglucan endotransglucosylase/hydrolase protein 2-like [Cucumis sativus]|uniref:xyloglucan endotransglucosylase/hydrolase protein 2-like n=1 Tax=Cucumis sativus TaxID=3659 RepID=UPI0012F49E3B|nr:xyloglucan endotransglucosylase/hydrolase protein 2-like [Cucumis sativus]KGN54635.2 hypothetical protein Csa_017891 [Cucumis sativus]
MKGSLFLCLVLVFISCLKKDVVSQKYLNFDKNYVVTSSQDHVLRLNGGTEAQLTLDQAGGGAFQSLLKYGSGYFEMQIKLPSNHSPGVVTTFYLHSDIGSDNVHDEIDFEFLGTDGPSYILQTNVFADDVGGREERLHLWFDPTLAFHNYGILWNSHQIVFFVDQVPIRVFKNLTSIGGRYPSQGMLVQGSIWNGEGWASNGRKVDWSQAPFQANYKSFGILGCQIGNQCDSQTLPWNNQDKWELNPKQQSDYENVKRKYVYDTYCLSPRGKNYRECHP